MKGLKMAVNGRPKEVPETIKDAFNSYVASSKSATHSMDEKKAFRAGWVAAMKVAKRQMSKLESE